jgi:F-type H+-transporting ATPase subunit b
MMRTFAFLVAMGFVNVCSVLAAPVDEGADHGDSTASVFAGTLIQSLAAAIVFLALLAILYKMAWAPILKGLQDREGKIKDDLESAERSARQASETLKEYQQQLAQAQVEARRVIDQARQDAERAAAQIKEQAQADLTAIRQRAEADIRSAKEKAVAELTAHVATLATQVAGRILQREVSADDHRRLIDDSLAKYGESAEQN